MKKEHLSAQEFLELKNKKELEPKKFLEELFEKIKKTDSKIKAYVRTYQDSLDSVNDSKEKKAYFLFVYKLFYKIFRNFRKIIEDIFSMTQYILATNTYRYHIGKISCFYTSN